MTRRCAHCDRPVLGETESVAIHVEESAREHIPDEIPNDYDAHFCDSRCLRDWMDALLDIIDEPLYDPDSSVYE